jgi:amino-acid N-acetyltransferase
MISITIDPAREGDLAPLLALLDSLNLPPDGLGAHLATTLVARQGAAIVGSAALECYGPAVLLRSVAVASALRGQGLGQRLTTAALDLAHQQGATEVYLLTETAASFFPRFGFHPTTREQVSAAVKQSVEFTSACPATALVMVRTLGAEAL